jgi:hypothetical protein
MDLAAIITSDVTDASGPDYCLTILAWKDCGLKIISPDGSRMNLKALSGVDLEAAIAEAVYIIQFCSNDLGLQQQPRIFVYRVPPGLTTAEQILSWLQRVPGVELEFQPPDGMGSDGPTPPGQAG